jgi:hypothetical protein
MATPAQLDLLEAIHERSPEGLGVAEDEFRTMGFARLDEDVAVLEAEGLLTRIQSTGAEPDTLALTDAGRWVLEPHNSQ